MSGTVRVRVAASAVHRGDPTLFTLDLRPDRVRLLVHDGLVIDALQA